LEGCQLDGKQEEKDRDMNEKRDMKTWYVVLLFI